MENDIELKAFDKKTITDEVEASILSAIFKGKIKPGKRLVELEIANILKVSRVPVREALQRLQRMGIITQLPRKGWIVSQITLESAADVFGVRKLLESLAARCAAKHINDGDVKYLKGIIDDMKEATSVGDFDKTLELENNFHRFLIEKSNRPFLIKTLEYIRVPIRLYISIARLMNDRDMENFAPRHSHILQAIKTKDPDKIEKAVSYHISLGEETILKKLKDYLKNQEKS